MLLKCNKTNLLFFVSSSSSWHSFQCVSPLLLSSHSCLVWKFTVTLCLIQFEHCGWGECLLLWDHLRQLFRCLWRLTYSELVWDNSSGVNICTFVGVGYAAAPCPTNTTKGLVRKHWLKSIGLRRTHPSHSQTSRLLSTSPSFGIPFPLST